MRRLGPGTSGLGPSRPLAAGSLFVAPTPGPKVESNPIDVPSVVGIEINDEDKNGLMLAVHKLDKSLGLDLILHTPGGSIAATESLGPVDPQYGNISPAGVIEEFDRAFNEIKADADRARVWQFIIAQYPPSFLGQCQNAVQRANDFVSEALQRNMLANDPNEAALAATI